MPMYEEESDESSEIQKRGGIWNQMKANWPIVIAALILIVAYQRYGDVRMDTGFFWASWIVVGGYALKWMEVNWKYKTPKIIMNPVHSSTNSEFDEISGYGIFRLGAIRYGFEIPGRDATVIAPLACINRVGRNIMLNVRVRTVKLHELPPDVAVWVYERKYPEPYLYGLLDDKIIIHHPEVTFVMNELTRAHTWIERLQSILDEKNITYEKYASHISRMANKAGSSPFKRVRERIQGAEG